MAGSPRCVLMRHDGRRLPADCCGRTQTSADRQSVVIQPIVVPLGTRPVCSPWLLESSCVLKRTAGPRDAALASKSFQTSCLGEGSKVTQRGLEADLIRRLKHTPIYFYLCEDSPALPIKPVRSENGPVQFAFLNRSGRACYLE